ncbi:ATPase [Chryseobacterium sp. T16E-39]|uniref:SRPBCC family protein n=1 Tax=Chryseobacterium sp. T16E-39 TaxID=2015076 RepID=UPI000B5B1FE7|nr:SRPBCC domain-containing protein [Chryseobacterium sp. T16E-39]ASK28874.1 ATPase [Chryseobacterium sp. T16E-39]
MKNQDFTTSLIVDASPHKVFEAINNVRGWWSENIDGSTNSLHDEFHYHYQDVHRAQFRIIEMIPDKKVVWHVLENYFKFTEDETEWKDTKVIFELAEDGGKTVLKFTHQGLTSEYECFQLCHDAWTHYIQSSLKDLIMTGKGSPTPKETGKDDLLQSDPISENQQEGKSICHRLLIKSPVEKVFEALTTQDGLAGWWTPDTIAKPEIGSILKFTFEPDYTKEMKVIELTPYSKVQWLCIKAYEEWIGTSLTFELEPHSKGSILFFRHSGWKDYTSEFASCSYAWALFFRSLKRLCETGTGIPYPLFDQ